VLNFTTGLTDTLPTLCGLGRDVAIELTVNSTISGVARAVAEDGVTFLIDMVGFGLAPHMLAIANGLV
jgi:dihydropteroate synthase